MKLPQPLADLTEPLFSAIPLEHAMAALVPKSTAPSSATDVVGSIVMHQIVLDRPILAAALWLYVDDLERSHQVSQGISGTSSSVWHGIMHRREGDFLNSKYWFRQAGPHPALKYLDPVELTDLVEKEHEKNPDYLVERQRREWRALFEWCATEAGKS